MGLFDTLLGRTKPVKANLDALFALPSAAVTLQAATGLEPARRAGTCFKPPSGAAFAQMQADVERLLQLPDDATPGATQGAMPGSASGATPGPASTPAPGTSPGPASGAAAPPGPPALSHVTDSFGYHWVLVEAPGIDDLVTRVHMVHSSMEDAGWSQQLLCSVFGFDPGTEPGADPELAASAKGGRVYVVYLAKRGSFYPFAPVGPEERDSELELRLRAVLGEDLPVESDLSRWFPLWDLPV